MKERMDETETGGGLFNKASRIALRDENKNILWLVSGRLMALLLIAAMVFSMVTPSIVNAYPTSYDLRSLGKVTTVGDQGSAHTCWAFATYGSLESTLLPGETWNFSENNMKNTAGFDYNPNSQDGTDMMAIAYLTRWSGPVLESDDPYNPYTTTSPSDLSVQKHMQDVIFVPPRSSPTDNDRIKWAITTYGGVLSGICLEGGAVTKPQYGDSYYNPSTYAYRYFGNNQPTHAITIVGWDDSFSRYNFATPPSGDGAFIVKNSNGSDWGDNGFFYVSYYDKYIGYGYNEIYTAEPITNYDDIYQYDPLGNVGGFGYGSYTGWFANVFTAATNESLAAVSFYTSAMNSPYEIYVYKDPTSGPINTSGAAGSKTGTLEYPGYHTVSLNSVIPLETSHKYSIVVKLTCSGDTQPITYEYPKSGYSSAASSNTGESYVSSDGSSWQDITTVTSLTGHDEANVCLKAFTVKSTQNIIKNPCFEQGWANWSTWTSGTDGTKEIVSNAVNPTSHSGIDSLHLAKTGYTSGALGVSTERYGAYPGDVTLKLWAKGSKSGTVYVKIQAYDASNNFISTGQFTLGSVSGSWGQQTFTWTMPANTAYTRVDVAAQCNCDLSFDDFELTYNNPPVNIIQNPGFEDNQNHWSFFTSGTDGTKEIVTTTYHSGAKSMHLAKTGYTSGAFGDSTEVYSTTPGDVQLKLWAKGSKSGTVQVKIQAYDANNNWLGTGQSSLGSVSSTWGQQTFTWTYPANTAKTRVDVAVQCNCDLYFDDFELVKT